MALQFNGDGDRKLVRIGNYALTGKVLGKGHFARVEEAIHIQLNFKVAVKIITYQDIKDNYTLKNMKREAKILSRLSHPSVMFLFETITSTRKYYIITELVSGGDLCTFIQSQPNSRLNEKQARPLARQIVAAVAHLHERFIVHRDLKMENILLDEAGQKIKLVDFNLSNSHKPNELLSTHCGSPEYAAPELYQSGRKYGPEVDIWSLGVIFYGMLIGRLPFLSWHQHSLSQDARRKNLIAETRKGLTPRHQRLLIELSCSSLFRNLIGKMLCPKSDNRITMAALQAHSWIYGYFYQSYPTLSDTWKRKALERIAKLTDISITDTYRMIKVSPYGKMAGIYNVLRYSEQRTRHEANSLRIDLTTITTEKKTSRDFSNEIDTYKRNKSKTATGVGDSDLANAAKPKSSARPLTADTKKAHTLELKASGVFCDTETKTKLSARRLSSLTPKKKKCSFAVSRGATPRKSSVGRSSVGRSSVGTSTVGTNTGYSGVTGRGTYVRGQSTHPHGDTAIEQRYATITTMTTTTTHTNAKNNNMKDLPFNYASIARRISASSRNAPPVEVVGHKMLGQSQFARPTTQPVPRRFASPALPPKIIGMANHTAARAAIRAELEKRANSKIQRTRK